MLLSAFGGFYHPLVIGVVLMLPVRADDDIGKRNTVARRPQAAFPEQVCLEIVELLNFGGRDQNKAG